MNVTKKNQKNLTTIKGQLEEKQEEENWRDSNKSSF
jgi:hypothetical protein